MDKRRREGGRRMGGVGLEVELAWKPFRAGGFHDGMQHRIESG